MRLARDSAARRLGPVAILLVLLGGCGKLGPPERFETSRVAGRVHIGPDPVGGGWIEFLPTGSAKGHMRSAPIDPSGRFEATRVARGTNAIRLVRLKGAGAGVRVFEQFHSGRIERLIGPGEAVSLDIDLAREAARLGREDAGGR